MDLHISRAQLKPVAATHHDQVLLKIFVSSVSCCWSMAPRLRDGERIATVDAQRLQQVRPARLLLAEATAVCEPEPWLSVSSHQCNRPRMNPICCGFRLCAARVFRCVRVTRFTPDFLQ